MTKKCSYPDHIFLKYRDATARGCPANPLAKSKLPTRSQWQAVLLFDGRSKLRSRFGSECTACHCSSCCAGECAAATFSCDSRRCLRSALLVRHAAHGCSRRCRPSFSGPSDRGCSAKDSSAVSRSKCIWRLRADEEASQVVEISRGVVAQVKSEVERGDQYR